MKTKGRGGGGERKKSENKVLTDRRAEEIFRWRMKFLLSVVSILASPFPF